MKVYYDSDADLGLIKDKKIAVLVMAVRATRTHKTCATAALKM